MLYKKPLMSVFSLTLLTSSAISSADTINAKAIVGIQHGKILSEFTAQLSSTTVPSQVIFAKEVKVTDPKITVSNPWQLAYPCDEKNSDGSAIIVITENTHVLRSCTALNSYDGYEMSIEKHPSTVLPQGSARRNLPDAITLNRDVLVIPSEAGVDSYIAWDGETYILVMPEEQEHLN